MYAVLEAISRFRFTVVKKMVLCDDQTLIVAECLVGIQSHRDCWHRQGVLADQEVFEVMDEDCVLQGAVEVQEDLVIFRT